MKSISSNGYTFQHDAKHAALARSRLWCVHKAKGGRYLYLVNVRRSNGKSTMIYFHRLVAKARKGTIVDHINGDTLDNRSVNLRVANQRLNQGNQRRVRGKVPYKGVTIEGGMYRARIRSHGRKLCLGSFYTAEAAAEAYRRRAMTVFGEYGYSNYVKD